jgi:sugar phosphate isomerase/epimerase
MNNKTPILGTTLYSFTNEWQRREYTFEQLVAKVAELGLGPGIEVVGFQSIRGYPEVTDEFARHFRSLFDKYGLFPSCLGANWDIGRQRNRLMNMDEILGYLQRQMVTAVKLGFPIMRIQGFVGAKTFEKVALIAEKVRVHVACELHAPLSIDDPGIVAMAETFYRVGSPYIGFIPDFSASMNRVPDVYWNMLRKLGAQEALIDEAQEIWKTDRPNPEKYAALSDAAARTNANPQVASRLNQSMTMFGHMPVKDWAELLPYTRHIHGKFYGVNESGTEPSIPYPEIMALLKKEGYQGTISAEWEGHAFTPETLGFEQVQRWHAMNKHLLSS